MTLPDRDLVAFLQRHRAHPPEASPALEAELMALIAAESPPAGSQRRWLGGAMVLALSLAAYAGLPLMQPRFSLSERAELALFLSETWVISAGSGEPVNTEVPWLLSADAETAQLTLDLGDLDPAQLSEQEADFAP